MLPFTHAQMSPQCNCVATVRYQGKWDDSENFAPMVEQEDGNPVSPIDDFVEHTFREHNQEADDWATVGAEGQNRSNNTETWKIVC